MRGFGFPIGPFELRDMAGVDVAWRNRQGRLLELSEREQRCDWIDKLYAAGRHGQKTGLGFYCYTPGCAGFMAGAIVGAASPAMEYCAP
ncbi:3-hydroxyacyl-CoA dehydrogenase family protein [Pseudomonas mandelii]|uniref:3-hydroxyacyl-CoA dehydrogenase family protein n=1 Tax=Pseudomonas mandelii TaxID=75612 RepID=UPI001E30C6D8|nr:3-hydroxyacyl-CoA dehydrogenase family protein [Pseudomonas mandelii]